MSDKKSAEQILSEFQQKLNDVLENKVQQIRAEGTMYQSLLQVQAYLNELINPPQVNESQQESCGECD